MAISSTKNPKPGTLAEQPDARFRLRIRKGDLVAIGPGKVALLEAIAEQGSISAAARSLGMSYRRAWLLVDELNRALAEPATESGPGGASGGGSTLTPVGERIVALYRGIETRAYDACTEQIRELASLMKP
ncbi:winged helix-turn-helix domain-containing protein [Bordetella genomosp. 11]|uniref:ModE family transcriptional regulator n=1 Tax=Bordetella genomosp. 11 TaxID=1416808 RepID=A0A261UFR6_9BORD|nr:LysR family transcriptional regulator [Bordetella genomosp. 11]OZI60435.1 ModE family transcriptional regulator [Bordetella genomosp. 11]